MTKPALVTVLVSMLCACGGGGSGALSIDDYPIEFHTAFCSYLARCGVVEDLATCLDTNLGPSFAFGVTSSARAAIEAGKTKFNGAAAEACFEAVASQSCDLTDESGRVGSPACDEITEGTEGDGGACALDFECLSRFCNVPACPSACCMGSCVGDTAPGRAGLEESCAEVPCEAGLTCERVTARCLQLQPDGAPCAAAADCEYGLSCRAGTCSALPGPGEPCTTGCRDLGMTCSQTSRTCVEVALAGEPCAQSSDCSPFYGCDATGHCSAGLPLGAPCNVASLCAGYRAFCDAPFGELNGVCAQPKLDGESCVIDDDCESFYCDESFTCIPEPVCF